jgi:GNAT superfamily N-acetyltransferase
MYAIGTQPEWRRGGIGRALTEHVLAVAWRRGARIASLQSTRMGQPRYLSHPDQWSILAVELLV